MKFSTIISHLYFDKEWHIQSNDEHSDGTADLAAKFASEFGMSEWGRFLGLLHDKGKEREGFQVHIRKSSGYDDTLHSKDSSFHSHIGAVLAHSIKEDVLFWLSNPIAGHHSGLYDTDELELILQKDIPEDVSWNIPDIKLPLPSFKPELKDASHICRMLFSCLVDADWLDTERFMDSKKADKREFSTSMESLLSKMEKHCQKFKSLPHSELNIIRSDVQKLCVEAAKSEPGFFNLTVPTGGGKTIASVLWALNHAIHHNKKRIIIAIPYTSIIVQTARILKDIFGKENVIEHHSVANFDDNDDRSILACENWDAPIIVTTNVQLFESIFSNKRSSCRKLHSICNSIVILDEIQTLPIHFLQPIVDAMKSYSKIFKTSFLFSTATLPILEGEHKGSSGAAFIGIEKDRIRNIVPPSLNLHDKLRRVALEFEETPVDYEELALRLSQFPKVLCIVNTRRHALNLYNSMPKDGVKTFHLSRSMCAAHILEKLQEIKQYLSEPDTPVRVISTQLIEAGVDIDFPVVFRQMAGLDSILQAAGRCNREGTLKQAITHVFSFPEDKTIGYLRFTTDTMRDLLHLFPCADWLSPVNIQLYYKKLYSRTPTFDRESISFLLNNPKTCRFEEASKKFNLIDEVDKNIIINFGNAEELIEKIKYAGPSRKIIRELGRLSVSIPVYQFNEFVKAGLIEEPLSGFFFISLKSQYNEETGLKTVNDYLENNYII